MIGALGSRYILVKEAARRLGVSRQRVHQLVRAGILGGVVYDGVHLVRVETVDARLATRAHERRPGRDGGLGGR